eukprot:scaffold81739_cov67-Cyclotella_meneghiniana.AAC.3
MSQAARCTDSPLPRCNSLVTIEMPRSDTPTPTTLDSRIKWAPITIDRYPSLSNKLSTSSIPTYPNPSQQNSGRKPETGKTAPLITINQRLQKKVLWVKHQEVSEKTGRR